MGVAQHLHIRVADYDRRIRTFIPYYEEMLRVAGDALASVRRRQPVLLDLGIGTGALTARCTKARPRCTVVGIDADANMLAAARQRVGRMLGERLTLVHGSFLRAPLPPCDAVVASFALHHVRTLRAKQRLYRRCFGALRAGGLLINADRMTAAEAAEVRAERAAWQAHLERTYSRARASAFLRAWGTEDVYLPLAAECALLARAGFSVEIPWQRHGFAVIVGWKDSHG